MGRDWTEGPCRGSTHCLPCLLSMALLPSRQEHHRVVLWSRDAAVHFAPGSIKQEGKGYQWSLLKYLLIRIS